MAFVTFRLDDCENRRTVEANQVPPTNAKGYMAAHPSLALLQLRQPHTAELRIVEEDPICAYLTSLSIDIFHTLCNSRRINDPLVLKHMSPSFSAYVEGRPAARNRGEHLKIWLESLRAMPELRVEVLSCIAKIHPDGRRAKVWSFKRLTNLPGGVLPGGITKEGVSIM